MLYEITDHLKVILNNVTSTYSISETMPDISIIVLTSGVIATLCDSVHLYISERKNTTAGVMGVIS